MNELEAYKEKWIILMKSGLVHWVSKETGEKASEHVSVQTGHSFMRIRELGGISINTAEMEGVYTHKQYEDMCRGHGGEWQCAYQNWHKKKGGECHCREEIINRHQQEELRKREEEEHAEMSPEDRKEANRRLRIENEMWALNGSMMFRERYSRGNAQGLMIHQSTLEEWRKRNGTDPNLVGLEVEEVTPLP